MREEIPVSSIGLSNSEIIVPEQISNVGTILRDLRVNHGYSLAQIGKKIGYTTIAVSRIERSLQEIPGESVLRDWFMLLGCGKKNTNKLILATRAFRSKHTYYMQPKELANVDILRLMAHYQQNALTDFDRALLSLVAREPLKKEI